MQNSLVTQSCSTSLARVRRTVFGARRCGLFLAIVSLFVSSLAEAGELQVFYARRIWTGTDIIENGILVIEDNKVRAVGARNLVEVRTGAVTHDLGDAVIIPGLVIAETSLGETSRDDERTLTPEVKAVDGFDFFTDYSRLIAGGVTTVQVSPGRSRLMPGQGGVVKLAGNDMSERILSDSESLRIILSSASRRPPRIYEPPTGAVSVDNPLKPTRPQVGASLASAVAGVRAILQTANGGKVDNSDGGAAFDFDALLGSIKTGRIRITANTAAEVRAALKIAEEFQLKLTLVNPTNLDQLAAKSEKPDFLNGVVLNVGVRPGSISNPAVPASDVPRTKTPWEYAAALIKIGLGDAIAIRPATDLDLDDMLFLGGLFTRSGTSNRDALKMLTANPARMLGVDDRVGTLAAGRDADFVVLSSDPFTAGSTVLATWIGGSSAFDRRTADRMTIVHAAAVYTDGGMQQNASVVVGGRKIRGVGTNVSAPGDAQIKRFRHGVIVPGFIDLSTGLGLGGPVSTTSVSTKLGTRLTADDESVKYARQGGVTTALLSTSGTTSPVLAFKLGETPRTLRDPVGIKFTISSNLTTGIPLLQRTLTSAKRYYDAWIKYDADMVEYNKQLKEYEVAKAKYDADKKKAEAAKKAEEAKQAAAKKTADATKTTTEKKPEAKPEDKPEEKPADSKDKPASKSEEKKAADKPADAKKPADTKAAAKPDPNEPKKPAEPKKPTTSSTYEPYRALFAGTIPAFVEADTILKLKAAVKLFREEFKLRTIIVGANDLYRVADLLAKNDVSVAVGPTLIREVENNTHNLPQILANHQIPFGFQSKATTGVRQLPWAIQYAVHKGLGTADALAGLTRQPAELISLNDQIGSIAVGKDADLVVLSGPPFEISSEVLAVMIDGVWVYEKETE